MTVRDYSAATLRTVLGPALIVSLLAMLPILAARHLPLVDAPAHEARIALLRTLWVQGGRSVFYRATDPVSANAAFDAIGVLMLRFMLPETVGRVFLGLIMVVTLWGIAVLNRVMTRRWSLVPLAVGLLLYHAVVIGCYFSYLFGLALVPWALAARLSIRRPFAGFAVGCLCTLVLMLSHLFAAGIYVAFLAADLAMRMAQRRLHPAGAMARLAEFLPAALLVPTVFSGSGGFYVHYLHQPGFLQMKAAGLAEALTCGSLGGDAALAVGLLSCLTLAWSRAKLVVSKPAAAGLLTLLMLYFILPFELGSAANVDKRMPIAMVFLAVGCTDVRVSVDGWTRWLTGALAAAFTFKQVALASLWFNLDPTIDAAVTALRALPPGAVIMQAECHPQVQSFAGTFAKWQPPLSHTAALATLDDRRFAASSWAIPGQQPIAVQPNYLPYYQLQGAFNGSLCAAANYRDEVALIRALTPGNSVPLPPVYLLLIRPPAPGLLVADVELVARGSDFELYAVGREARPTIGGSSAQPAPNDRGN